MAFRNLSLENCFQCNLKVSGEKKLITEFKPVFQQVKGSRLNGKGAFNIIITDVTSFSPADNLEENIELRVPNLLHLNTIIQLKKMEQVTQLTTVKCFQAT